MTLKRTMLVTIASLALWASTSHASPFVNPPEENDMIPDGGWVGDFPYQRNARIDFTTDPNTWPDDANDPTKTELHPDVNYDLEGDDDTALYPSDWCYSEGDVLWYDEVPVGTGRQGMIGFLGLTSGEGTLTWHLDNWPDPNKVKHVYLEMEFYTDGTGHWGYDVTAAEPATVGTKQESYQDLGGGWYRADIYIPIEPNPLWEELSLSFEVTQAGPASFLLDYVHVATECVPEPAAALVLLLGFAGALRRRRRR